MAPPRRPRERRIRRGRESVVGNSTQMRRRTALVLRIDPDREPERAKQAYDSHLVRAQWMSGHGYRQILQSSSRPNVN